MINIELFPQYQVEQAKECYPIRYEVRKKFFQKRFSCDRELCSNWKICCRLDYIKKTGEKLPLLEPMFICACGSEDTDWYEDGPPEYICKKCYKKWLEVQIK